MGMVKNKMMDVEQEGQDAFMRFNIDNPNPYANTMFSEVWQDAFDAQKVDYHAYLSGHDADAPLPTPESF